MSSMANMFHRVSWAVFLMIAAVPASGYAQTPMEGRSKVDLSALGPHVGQPVPDFSLRDQTGAARTLASVMGPNGAMLVFYRSADW